MKRLFFAATLLLAMLCFKPADAQISISLNIGTQPDWGPTGYDHVDYYYLPDIDCYYYVPSKQFVYRSGSRWVWRSSLPQQYSNYDFYNSYKVVVNKPKPYVHDTDYRSKYASYKGRHDQPLIRYSHDDKYRRPANNNRQSNNKPAPHPASNHPSGHQKPAQPTEQHRPATNNHQTPQKQKQGEHHPEDKKDKKEHH